MKNFVVEWVGEAVTTLGLTSEQFRRLPRPEADQTLQQIKQKFLRSPDRLIWWECFVPDAEVYKPTRGDGFKFIPLICPRPADPAWFVADLTGADPVPVYECAPALLPGVLGECPGFEYAVVTKNLEWLVLENHHDCLFAVGKPAAENLRRLRAAPSDRPP